MKIAARSLAALTVALAAALGGCALPAAADPPRLQGPCGAP